MSVIANRQQTEIYGGKGVGIETIVEAYEYCQIKYQIQDGRSDRADGLVWGQFIAVVEGAAYPKVVAHSATFPLTNSIRGQFFPDVQNAGHRTILDIFVDTLSIDGWELSQPDHSDLWWGKRLRRPKSMTNPHLLRQRLVTAFAHYY